MEVFGQSDVTVHAKKIIAVELSIKILIKFVV